MSKATFPDMLLVRVERLRRGMDDLSPVMPEMEREMWEDNEYGLLHALDRHGRPLAGLAESTLERRYAGVGPPLIPRFRNSRAIANYRVGHIRKGPGHYLMIGAWQDVVSTKGVPFLSFHFEGRGHLPVRDLRGVCPRGKGRMRAILHSYLAGV